MKPAGVLSVTDRQKLKEITLQAVGTVPAGRVMWCQDRAILSFSNVADLANVISIPKRANILCVSREDFADIKEWLA